MVLTTEQVNEAGLKVTSIAPDVKSIEAVMKAEPTKGFCNATIRKVQEIGESSVFPALATLFYAGIQLGIQLERTSNQQISQGLTPPTN